MEIKTQEISLPLLKEKEIKLFIKRTDQTHQHISGNKWYKLKYNLIEAKKQGFKTLLTFGGAYSNHIAATACATKENGFKSIGVIRGEEHLPLNPTLQFAKEQGMHIHYVSRSDYREKTTPDFLEKLKVQFSDFYLIPEGGSNELAIQGTAEILDANDTHDFVCCAVGTGGTIVGIINASTNKQTVIGFPAIKGILEKSKFVVSGRHHLNVFSLLANKPFITFESNTWKIEGVCEMLDYNSNFEMDLSKKNLDVEFPCQILTIPFEDFVTKPDIHLNEIAKLIDSEITTTTLKTMIKQKVPRKKYSDGIPKRNCVTKKSGKSRTV